VQANFWRRKAIGQKVASVCRGQKKGQNLFGEQIFGEKSNGTIE
jgi:hypothetical protein